MPLYVLGLAQDERPADLHMAQPNVPVSKTGHWRLVGAELFYL
jgi:hypothetical protein